MRLPERTQCGAGGRVPRSRTSLEARAVGGIAFAPFGGRAADSPSDWGGDWYRPEGIGHCGCARVRATVPREWRIRTRVGGAHSHLLGTAGHRLADPILPVPQTGRCDEDAHGPCDPPLQARNLVSGRYRRSREVLDKLRDRLETAPPRREGL